MKITIETIPHAQQRYDTCGDWFYTVDGALHIKVSALADWRKETLVAVHELIEALACKHAGVSQKQVDEFDLNYVASDPTAEPGDSPLAPYRRQHCTATGIERILASELDVTWSEHELEINSLEWHPTKPSLETC